MWIDTRDCIPLCDGEYAVQTVYGRITHMNYTTDGGWNTSRDANGVLSTEYAIEDPYVVRWYNMPTPPDIPTEWVDEYETYREGVNECDTE